MLVDDMYWNSLECDSDESISNAFPRQYVDPWDLENYAYIRQHLDSLDVSSDHSNSYEPFDGNSSLYYTPAVNILKKSQNRNINNNHMYGSSHYEMARYAKIDDATYVKKQPGNSTQRCNDRGSKVYAEDIYGTFSFGVESDLEDSVYGEAIRNSSHSYMYDPKSCPRPISQPPAVKRRAERSERSQSFCNSRYKQGRDNSELVGCGAFEEILVNAESEKMVPIYDDLRSNKCKPNNFGLNNYGHLQIDYSCSWNNLNKYIYN